LELLDACAKIALAKSKTTITLDVVEEADRHLEHDGLLNTLNALTKHQKLLYLTLLKLGKETTGSFLKIRPGFAPEAKTGFIFGFGPVTLTVTAEDVEKSATAFVVGPLVFNVG
jgi:hypothetical protein